MSRIRQEPGAAETYTTTSSPIEPSSNDVYEALLTDNAQLEIDVNKLNDEIAKLNGEVDQIKSTSEEEDPVIQSQIELLQTQINELSDVLQNTVDQKNTSDQELDTLSQMINDLIREEQESAELDVSIEELEALQQQSEQIYADWWDALDGEEKREYDYNFENFKAKYQAKTEIPDEIYLRQAPELTPEADVVPVIIEDEVVHTQEMSLEDAHLADEQLRNTLKMLGNGAVGFTQLVYKTGKVVFIPILKVCGKLSLFALKGIARCIVKGVKLALRRDCATINDDDDDDKPKYQPRPRPEPKKEIEVKLRERDAPIVRNIREEAERTGNWVNYNKLKREQPGLFKGNPMAKGYLGGKLSKRIKQRLNRSKVQKKTQLSKKKYNCNRKYSRKI